MAQAPSIMYVLTSREEKQIRTLTLYAGKVHNPIRCSLHIVSLEEQPPYEALSYTWGYSRHTSPIEVDGVEFNATINLERALRHLREDDRDLTLWVDAGEWIAQRDWTAYYLLFICSLHQSERHRRKVAASGAYGRDI